MKTVFFDIGYTLVNEDAVWEKRCKEQAETEEAKQSNITPDDIYNEMEKAAICGLPQYRTMINRFHFNEIAPYRHEFEELYEDALYVLKTLSGKYKLGVIANQPDGLKKRLESFGILQYFTYIVSSWDVQLVKPDIRIFEYALKTAECTPENAFMVGDRIDNDIIPAKAVGMKTIWIKHGFGKLQTELAKNNAPDHAIECLTELLKIL